MNYFPEMESTATTLFSAYASVAATMMLVRSMANEIIPHPIKSYLSNFIHYLFTPLSNNLTIIVDEQSGMCRNQVYDSAEMYLGTKISPNAERFRVSKSPRQKNIHVAIEKNQEVFDTFKDVQLKWRFVSVEPQGGNNSGYSPEKKYFELSFDKKFKEVVIGEYLPFVIEKAREIKEHDRVVKLYTRDCPTYDSFDDGGSGVWGSVNLEHPATFDTLAMEPEMKKGIIDDLDRFVARREYYKKVGKAWKRGYLLYGPPGTGKSSLIAAMANYLKFDIYDLELTSLYSNSELRRILVSTTNRSIIVIEDIDCSVEMQDRANGNEGSNTKLTLSGLLNFIDGLWSSCGDERIIIFTTNHKDKIDPALLRPGRMDMHIHMSYCTNNSFKILAYNYLGINDHPRLFGEVEGLIEDSKVTPAEVAEELMRSEEPDVALDGVVNLLKRKRIEVDEVAKDVEEIPANLEEANGIVHVEENGYGPGTSAAKRLKNGTILRGVLRNYRARSGRGG
ncbi:hypothetical protein Leryth_012955 [Lithospermum erythrorhizon]|nr:hypothetical protein Leryth_012955 [Lithospermum erythrorhizon]